MGLVLIIELFVECKITAFTDPPGDACATRAAFLAVKRVMKRFIKQRILIYG